jgi:glycosyltransferase involved in cell wall biosynthesis
MSGILVVTPTLGTSAWLDETVASVVAQASVSRQVLVCPAEVGADLKKRFPQTQVVTEPGGGMYTAINAGLAAATGEWEAFTYLNDDDLLLPAFAAHARAVERAGSRPLVAYGNVKLIDGCGRRLGAIPVSVMPSMNRALYAQRIEPVYQHGTLVTRAALEVLRGFDASFRFCGDSEFLARACLAGIPFQRTGGRAVAAFRLRTGQLTKNRAAMVAERAAVDAKLGLVGCEPRLRRLVARMAFRTENLPIYVERVLRHGWVSFDELLSQA